MKANGKIAISIIVGIIIILIIFFSIYFTLPKSEPKPSKCKIHQVYGTTNPGTVIEFETPSYYGVNSQLSEIHINFFKVDDNQSMWKSPYTKKLSLDGYRNANFSDQQQFAIQDTTADENTWIQLTPQVSSTLIDNFISKVDQTEEKIKIKLNMPYLIHGNHGPYFNNLEIGSEYQIGIKVKNDKGFFSEEVFSNKYEWKNFVLLSEEKQIAINNQNLCFIKAGGEMLCFDNTTNASGVTTGGIKNIFAETDKTDYPNLNKIHKVVCLDSYVVFIGDYDSAEKTIFIMEIDALNDKYINLFEVPNTTIGGPPYKDIEFSSYIPDDNVLNNSVVKYFITAIDYLGAIYLWEFSNINSIELKIQNYNLNLQKLIGTPQKEFPNKRIVAGLTLEQNLLVKELTDNDGLTFVDLESIDISNSTKYKNASFSTFNQTPYISAINTDNQVDTFPSTINQLNLSKSNMESVFASSHQVCGIYLEDVEGEVLSKIECSPGLSSTPDVPSTPVTLPDFYSPTYETITPEIILYPNENETCIAGLTSSNSQNIYCWKNDSTEFSTNITLGELNGWGGWGVIPSIINNNNSENENTDNDSENNDSAVTGLTTDFDSSHNTLCNIDKGTIDSDTGQCICNTTPDADNKVYAGKYCNILVTPTIDMQNQASGCFADNNESTATNCDCHQSCHSCIQPDDTNTDTENLCIVCADGSMPVPASETSYGVGSCLNSDKTYKSSGSYDNATSLTSTITNNCHTNCASCLGNSGDSNKCFVCQNRTLPLEKQPDGTGTC